MKRRISIILILLLLCLNNGGLQVFANYYWSAQAIANFIRNDVDAPNVLVDEKYLERITRAELCELIIAIYAKSLNIDKNEIIMEDNPFKDTTALDVQRAYSLGIVRGVSEDTFLPDTHITREQMVTVIARFLNVKGVDTNSSKDLSYFTDNAKINEWAVDAMRYCVEKGIIEGYAIGELKPQSNATVEQAITVLSRIAVEAGWIWVSSDQYLSGFFVPSDTEIALSPNASHWAILDIQWNRITDMQKLEADIFYVLEYDPVARELIDYTFPKRDMRDSTTFKGENFEVGVGIGTSGFSLEIRRAEDGAL